MNSPWEVSHEGCLGYDTGKASDTSTTTPINSPSTSWGAPVCFEFGVKPTHIAYRDRVTGVHMDTPRRGQVCSLRTC